MSLPASLDGQPFPGEPLGCAMNILRRSEIRAGQTVAIVGIGFLGALLTKLVTDAGARVIAISRRDYSLEVARRMGAAEVLFLDNETVGHVKDLTGGNFCDRVIEAVGKQEALDLAGELTRERGRLMIAGYHQAGRGRSTCGCGTGAASMSSTPTERDPQIYMRGIREAVAAVAEGRLDLQPLYTHRYPLERLGEALDATRDRPEGFLKALVVFP